MSDRPAKKGQTMPSFDLDSAPGENRSGNVSLEDQIAANQKIFTEYFDVHFTRGILDNILRHIDELYFRSEFIGFENLPQRNNPNHPLIYFSNHSGMAFPWDAIIFSAGLFRRNQYQFDKSLRPLAAPMLSQSVLMNPFLVDQFWKRAGGIDATTLNFETVMRYRESNVLIYPEGVPGIGKGFNNRYRLQRFATSFIRMSVKYRTDIVPVLTINGEYINPYAYQWPALNRLVNKVGIPFIPVGFMTLLIPFQPWLFYFGFPAKLVYVLGEPLKPYEMTDKPFEEMTREDFTRLADEVRARTQAELDKAVARYGKRPYRPGEMLRVWSRNLKRFPFFLPCFWPSLFLEYDRQYQKTGSANIRISFWAGLRALIRNPIALAFFLPIIGWIPILWRGMRRRHTFPRNA